MLFAAALSSREIAAKVMRDWSVDTGIGSVSACDLSIDSSVVLEICKTMPESIC